MNDLPTSPPPAIAAISERATQIGFNMSSEVRTGALLRTLAAGKPGGSILELGTGVGVGTAWLLDGMDAHSHLVTVESDGVAQAIARDAFGSDPRIEFVLSEGEKFLVNCTSSFDLIFADTWPGKFHHLDEALRLVKPGGFYVVDDLLPQENWPEDHPPKVVSLQNKLMQFPGFVPVSLAWASGLMILARKP